MHGHFVFIFVCLALIVIRSPNAFGHKGSPWHDSGTLSAVGLNTAFLTPSAPGVSTTFIFQYPVRANTLGCIVGNEHVAMVFSDSALADGFFDQDEVLGMATGEVYSEPLSVRFTITQAGYYHFLFGPGPSTSILVLEAPPNGTISVTPEGGGSVSLMVPTTAGDVHLVKKEGAGFREFIAWIGVMFAPARVIYTSLHVAEGALPPLDGSRAQRLARKLGEFGYINPGAIPDPYPPGPVSAPLLASINGLGTLCFATAYLQPGRYTFAYNRRATGLVFDRVRSVVLQVTHDNAYDDGFGTEKEILFQSEYPAATLNPTLTFQVVTAGYYHFSYGPGDCGFLLHLDPDDQLPVTVVSLDGKPVPYLRRLGGIHTMVWNEQELNFNSRQQTFFPCKLANEEEFRMLGIMTHLTVPLSPSIALEVSSRWSLTPIEYTVRGGGKFVAGGVVSSLRMDLQGISTVGSAAIARIPDVSFRDTCDIRGTMTAFSYQQRTLVDAVSFTTLDAVSSGNGSFDIRGDGTARVNGVLTPIVFETRVTARLISFQIRNLETGAVLAGGTGEAGRAGLAMIVEPVE